MEDRAKEEETRLNRKGRVAHQDEKTDPPTQNTETKDPVRVGTQDHDSTTVNEAGKKEEGRTEKEGKG